jgi:hypothetical protein
MKRVLFLPTPGLLLNALPLDALLGYSVAQDFGALEFTDSSAATNFSESILLVQPSDSIHANLAEGGSSNSASDATLLEQTFPDHEMPEPPRNAPNLVIGDMAGLRKVADDFNGNDFEESLSYMHMQDPLLPGPEFDVPRDMLKEAWPENTDAKYLYRNLHDKYRQRRMDVCGLGLEHWEPNPSPPEL